MMNRNNAVRRNNLNPNAGIWQGWFPQGENQPGNRGMGSRPQSARNYAASGGTRTYGPASPLIGDTLGKRAEQSIKGLARQGLQSFATAGLITGSLEPGFPTQKTGESAASPEAQDHAAAQRKVTEDRMATDGRALGAADQPMGALGPGYPDRRRRDVDDPRTPMGGPWENAATQGPRAPVEDAVPMRQVGFPGVPEGMALPAAGNLDFEAKANRQLGPGPSTQFPESTTDIRGELAQAAQAIGGKIVGGQRPGFADTPKASHHTRRAANRRAGGAQNMLGRALGLD